MTHIMRNHLSSIGRSSTLSALVDFLFVPDVFDTRVDDLVTTLTLEVSAICE